MKWLSLFCIVSSFFLSGYTRLSGSGIPWQYLSSYSSNGKPDDVVNIAGLMPAGLLSSLVTSLPESRDIRLTNPDYVGSFATSGLRLKAPADIEVVFLHEGAGYRNSLAYYSHSSSSLPVLRSEITETVIFPNSSFESGNGSPGMSYGDSVSLGSFSAGQEIGFTLISNGWTGSQVNPNKSDDWIFYTQKSLNSEQESADQLNGHVVLLQSDLDDLIIMGFEDINRENAGCDHDFNDLVIAVRVTPFSAVDLTNVFAVADPDDTDGDGVANANDQFPNDASKAFLRYYPSESTMATLAWEDNWPNQADYDLNDLVVYYRTKEALSPTGALVDLDIDMEFSARGAEYNNGFAWHLAGVSSSAVKLMDDQGGMASWWQWQGQEKEVIPQASGQSEVVLEIVENTKQLLAPESATCNFYNTQNACSAQSSKKGTLHLEFNQAQTAQGLPPFDPFLFRTFERDHEIHLPDRAPTELMNRALFGQGQDNSNPGAGRYYRTQNNLPWALDLPVRWQFPIEQNSILKGYNLFDNWFISGGINNQNWYQQQSDTRFIFLKSI